MATSFRICSSISLRGYDSISRRKGSDFDAPANVTSSSIRHLLGKGQNRMSRLPANEVVDFRKAKDGVAVMLYHPVADSVFSVARHRVNSETIMPPRPAVY
jgi:hypothetical protein